MKHEVAARRRWRLAVVVGALWAAAMAAPAAREYRAVEVAGLRVVLDSDWVARATPGYLPVRFDITNTGDARVIEVVGQGMRSFRGIRGGAPAGSASSIVRQEIRLGPGDRVRFTMPVPAFADAENIAFEIRENGRRLERFTYTGFQSRTPANDASALIVSDASGPLRAIASRAPRVAVGRTSGSGPSLEIDRVLEPERLPTTWIGLTSVQAVVLRPAEWTALSEAQRSAVLNWVASGGDLLLVDGDPAAILPAAALPLTPATGPPASTGSSATAPATATAVRPHLFGRIHSVPLSTLEPAGLAPTLAAIAATRDVHWSMPVNGAADWGLIEDRGFRFRIPGVEGVPARMYLSILVVFALLIGPLNYWILRRKRRLVLFVLTAPVISIVFILLLTGYAVAGEGFRVLGRVVSYTMLDQQQKLAVSRVGASFYAAGVVPSGGLRFPRDVAIFPLGLDGLGARGTMELNLTDEQRFATGILQARSPANFEQIAIRPARERLTFAREGADVRVTNGLDAAVLGLVYRDATATYRLDAPVASGATAILRAAAAGAREALAEGVALPAKFIPLIERPAPDSYVAVLDRSPFWSTGVPTLVERGSVHVVVGWPEGQR